MQEQNMDIYCLYNDETRKVPVDIVCSLFPERYKRGMRYRFEKDRLLCIGAGLLQHYLIPLPESSVLFTENGKPYVENGEFFNLSHSGTMAAAVKDSKPVGLDIELIGGDFDPLIAERVFTVQERRWADAMPIPRYYLLWCIKESIMKAVGTGLSDDPVTLEVPLFSPGKPAVFMGYSWHYQFTTFNNYAVAAAALHPIDHLVFHVLDCDMVCGKKNN